MKSRGDIKVTIGGKERVLRPSFATIEGIEEATGKSFLQLLQEMRAQSIRLGEVVTVLWLGLKGAGEKVSRDTVGEWVYAEGFTTFIQPASSLVLTALGGGNEASSGNEESGETKKEGE